MISGLYFTVEMEGQIKSIASWDASIQKNTEYCRNSLSSMVACYSDQSHKLIFNGCTSALGSAEGALPHLLSHVSLLAVAWRVSKDLAVWLFNLWYWCITQKQAIFRLTAMCVSLMSCQSDASDSEIYLVSEKQTRRPKRLNQFHILVFSTSKMNFDTI